MGLFPLSFGMEVVFNKDLPSSLIDSHEKTPALILFFSEIFTQKKVTLRDANVFDPTDASILERISDGPRSCSGAPRRRPALAPIWL